jgi:hypothetical protein
MQEIHRKTKVKRKELSWLLDEAKMKLQPRRVKLNRVQKKEGQITPLLKD